MKKQRETVRNRKPMEGKELVQVPVKKSAKAKISDVLQMPQNVFSGVPTIEMTSNTEAIVEGCKGVIEYDDTIVKLNLGSLMVRFIGRNLQIKCFTNDSVMINGYILSVEFMT